ncbi:MAG: hypothetical protein K1X57_11670 [Gemmataceae bacterium]|nr:hypothetical protein [Gemmataceae bacterium]
MLKFVVASLVLVLSVAHAAADEFVGHITKFEDGKMTVQKSKGTEAPEEVTLKFDDNVKIFRSKFNKDTQKIEAGEAYEGGKDALSKQVKEHAENVKKWTKEGKKGFGPGVFASIVTNGDKVTELRVSGGGKKKEEKKKNDK